MESTLSELKVDKVIDDFEHHHGLGHTPAGFDEWHGRRFNFETWSGSLGVGLKSCMMPLVFISDLTVDVRPSEA